MALPEILTGMRVVIGNVFKKKETMAYPEVRRQPWPRFRGRHILDRHPDGLEKCIGCELCAGACPADAIYVVGAENTPEARFSPGERYAQIYQINYLRCIFCGLCVEACPTEALLMTTEYEISADSRDELIYTKDQLIVDAPIVRHWDTKVEFSPDGKERTKVSGGGRVRDARHPEEIVPGAEADTESRRGPARTAPGGAEEIVPGAEADTESPRGSARTAPGGAEEIVPGAEADTQSRRGPARTEGRER